VRGRGADLDSLRDGVILGARLRHQNAAVSRRIDHDAAGGAQFRVRFHRVLYEALGHFGGVAVRRAELPQRCGDDCFQKNTQANATQYNTTIRPPSSRHGK